MRAGFWKVSLGALLACLTIQNSLAEIPTKASEDENRAVIGDSPMGLAVSRSTGVVYVADRGRDQIVLVDATTLEVLRRIKVGSNPMDVAIDEERARLYVVHDDRSDRSKAGFLSTFRLSSTHRISRIRVGRRPTSVGIDKRTGIVAVANFASESVTIVFPESKKTVDFAGRRGLFGNPTDVAAHDGSVYVAVAGGSIYKIDALRRRLTSHRFIGESDTPKLALDTRHRTLFATHDASQRVVALDSRGLGIKSRIDLQYEPIDLAVDPIHDVLLAAVLPDFDTGEGGGVIHLDTKSYRPIHHQEFGVGVWGIQIWPKRLRYFVIDPMEGTLSRGNEDATKPEVHLSNKGDPITTYDGRIVGRAVDRLSGVRKVLISVTPTDDMTTEAQRNCNGRKSCRWVAKVPHPGIYRIRIKAIDDSGNATKIERTVISHE